MIRPFTLICILLAIGSGLYLYRVKYRAQLLDREIHATLRAADDSRARAALLRADYALLNDPIRLQELAEQYLPLKTTQPTQFTTLADLERRLPRIGITPPEPAPEPEIPAAVIRPEPRPTAPPVAVAPRPVQPAPPTPQPQVAAAPPPPRPAIVAAPLPPPAAATPVAPPAVAAAPRPPTPLAPPSPAPQAAPAAAPPRVVTAQPAAPPPAASRAASSTMAAASPTPSDTGPPVVRSSLGMARRMAPQTGQMSPGGGGEN